MNIRYVTVQEALEFHRRVLNIQGEVPQPILSTDRLEAAIARPASTAFGEDAFPTLAEKAAALLHGLITGHPFADGNKRVAFAAVLLFFRLNGVATRANHEAIGDLVLEIAEGTERDVESVAARLATLFGLE